MPGNLSAFENENMHVALGIAALSESGPNYSLRPNFELNRPFPVLRVIPSRLVVRPLRYVEHVRRFWIDVQDTNLLLIHPPTGLVRLAHRSSVDYGSAGLGEGRAHRR